MRSPLASPGVTEDSSAAMMNMMMIEPETAILLYLMGRSPLCAIGLVRKWRRPSGIVRMEWNDIRRPSKSSGAAGRFVAGSSGPALLSDEDILHIKPSP
jgi:hypothetical protein